LGEKPPGDFFVVYLFDLGDHVRADDAGLDFENLNALVGQPLRENHAGHAFTRLRDAVFRPVDRSRKG
jgi:hypothetical protein